MPAILARLRVADSLRELDDVLVTVDLTTSIEDLEQGSKELKDINRQGENADHVRLDAAHPVVH